MIVLAWRAANGDLRSINMTVKCLLNINLLRIWSSVFTEVIDRIQLHLLGVDYQSDLLKFFFYNPK